MVKNEDDECIALFNELQISVLTKAINITPYINSVTLGKNISDETINVNNSSPSSKINDLLIPYSSTPKKTPSHNYQKSLNFTVSEENKEKIGVVPEGISTTPDSLCVGYSSKKLLNEYDTLRRLTVDKVMRERIQNMYDTKRLIRNGLEDLHQSRLEEGITKRMLLESKIINDIHKLEILNKPKKEAQLEQDNLKEAQRIQERNQKFKDAEEEARRKSEAILLKKKQTYKILFDSQKEYNEEYKKILEIIKSCKDKAAMTELASKHSKILKDCAILFETLIKKSKEGEVLEEDVINAVKSVKTIKLMHEFFIKEVTKINEAYVNKQESEQIKITSPEEVQKEIQKLMRNEAFSRAVVKSIVGHLNHSPNTFTYFSFSIISNGIRWIFT
ncbi:conserved hypothetical protein [Pediculus humanus corporis]|uniref:Uncharacterized protein n=1 Tax=Pediculus humanus subsp. corporis TaxID=121224 RepID=E0VTV0_PEDHC|nr:uncharacterized protein Phum_PHUM438330 [Pediculus humanus corporis]EEB16806.1 conserved hypothetical protein [Pediculus humanus corporis]